MRKTFCFLLSLFALFAGVKAQDIKVSGRVTESATGEPVQSASIIIKGISKGVSTNSNGDFSITANKGATLTISSIGYIGKEVIVNFASVNITLEKANNNLTDVVVVGYGTQKKANLTGALVTIKSEDLMKRQVASASNLLQGIAPGVTVQQQSGKPGGDGANIRIRGIGSISAGTYPLVLVDNVEMSIDAIDPNAIETITVLKDAASTAIFGARAANGVILVTTKRAKKGTALSYHGWVSSQKATNLPQKLSAVEHMELYNEMEVNSSKPKVFSDAVIQAYKDNAPDNFRYFNTDWVNGVFTNNGLMQNHNITVSSGTDKLSFLASGTYLKQQGLTANTNYEKFDLRMNTDIKVTDKLTLTGDFVFNNSIVTEPGSASPEFIIRQALGIPAIGAGKFEEGKYGDAGQSNSRNPIAQAEASGQSTNATPSLIMKAGFNFRPIKNLEIQGFYANNTYNVNGKNFVQQYSVYRPDLVSNTLKYVSLYPTLNSISESYAKGRRNNILLQAAYTMNFNKHNLKVMGGFQSEDFRQTGLSASRDSLINNQPYINNAISISRRNAGGVSEYALAGFFGRINYSFADKYLLEVNGRYDGSSRFSDIKHNQWGFFPSVSAGWVLSQENFFAPIKNAVNFMKIRASYGMLGNQNIGGYYPYTATFSPGQNYYFGGITTTGYAVLDAANENIQWETSVQSDIGLDINLLKNKISVTADYYQRKLQDMLLRKPIPIWVNLNAPFINAGNMVNKGWELGITYRNKINDFKYDVSFNVSDVKNTVTDLDGQELNNGLFISRVGNPLNSYYGYQADGLFQSDAEVLASAVQSPTTKAGDIRYKDISGIDGKPDKKIDNYDRVILGNNFPRYEYSFNMNASWKGIDINAFFQGVGKRQTYVSGTGAWAFYAADFIATAYDFHKDRWTPTNTNASYPRLTDGVGVNFNNSSYWMQDGAYLRLKNIAVGYSLPAAIINRLKVQQVRFYVSGQNLITWDHYFPGFDVEKNEQNGEFYPIMKTFTVGANIRL